MINGSSSLSIELLERGANPNPKALVERSKRLMPFNFRVDLDRVTDLSALFAPLLANANISCRHSSVHTEKPYKSYDPPKYYDKFLVDKIISVAISPVVDRGYFNTDSVVNELEDLVANHTVFSLCSISIRPHEDIVSLLFGKVSAGGLKQMCVRVIMERVIFNRNPGKFEILTH